MKKYITAAALLAAGTAFADAATLVAQWDSFDFGTGGKSAASTLGTTTLTVEAKGSSTTSTSNGLLNVVGASAYANETQVDLASVSFSDGLTFVISVQNFTDRSGALVAMFGSEDVSGAGIGTGKTSNDWIVNTGSWGKTASVDSAATATLVLTYDGSNLKLYAGNNSTSSTSLTLSETVAYSTLTTNTLSLGSFVKGSPSGTGTFSVSRMAIYSGVLSESDITSGKVYSAIPEPSAFGLLAGAGALALVAARRRRRSK